MLSGFHLAAGRRGEAGKTLRVLWAGRGVGVPDYTKEGRRYLDSFYTLSILGSVMLIFRLLGFQNGCPFWFHAAAQEFKLPRFGPTYPRLDTSVHSAICPLYRKMLPVAVLMSCDHLPTDQDTKEIIIHMATSVQRLFLSRRDTFQNTGWKGKVQTWL